MQSYLREHTRTPLETATEVTANINASNYASRSELGVVGEVANLWATILALAEQIPYDHSWQDRLIHLFRAIKELPPPSHLNTDTWRHRGYTTLWDGLPTPGRTIYEVENGDGLFYSFDRAHDATVLTRGGWVNFNAFLARIAEAGILALGPTTSRELFAFILDQGAKTSRLNDNVPAAAAWILYAERFMHDVVTKDEDGLVDWSSLRERFCELGHDETLRRNTRDWAMGAVERMDQIRE